MPAGSCSSANSAYMGAMHRAEFDDPQKRPRYTGLPTFMRTPWAGEDWSEVEIGLVGVPFDGGVTNRTGARHGPREVRNQSSLIRKINQATRIAPFEAAKAAASLIPGARFVPLSGDDHWPMADDPSAPAMTRAIRAFLDG